MEQENNKTSALFKKIFELQKYLNEVAPSFEKDGVNLNQKYEYVKAEQYKKALREGVIKCGLTFKVNIIDFVKLDNQEKRSTTTIVFRGNIVLIDIDTGECTSYNCIAVGADVLDKQASKAETLMIKDFIKGNFLIGDNENDPEADIPSPINITSTKPTPVIPPKADERKVMQEAIVQNEPTDEKSKNIQHCLSILKKIREATNNPSEGTKLEAKLIEQDSSGKYVISEINLAKQQNLLEGRADDLGIQY